MSADKDGEGEARTEDPRPQRDGSVQAQPATAKSGVFSPRVITGSAPSEPENLTVRYESIVIGESTELSDGTIRSELAGAAWTGRTNEGWAAKTLAQAISLSTGEPVRVMAGEDARGTDRFLEVGTRSQAVQLTATIQDSRWKELSRAKTHARTESVDDLAQGVLDSVQAKAEKTAERDRRTVILALDAQQIPAARHKGVRRIATQQLGAAAGLGFQEIWIVGPTVETTFKLFPVPVESA
jgi:hypothetical protein